MVRRPDNPRLGLPVIDKPRGSISHNVASRVRRLAHIHKVGHGGALGPMTTGVLMIGIGKTTRLLTWASGHSKEYRVAICFGVATNTDDVEGAATTAVGCASLSEEQLEAAFTPLRKGIMQVPSTVSVIKVNGKRAYALARAGNDVELAVRPMHISRLEVFVPPRPAECTLEEADADNTPDEQVPSGLVRVIDVDAVVECSSGTYIHALAHDADGALGVGAHLTTLCRTRVDDVHLDTAITLKELDAVVEAATPGGEPDAKPVLPLAPLGEAAHTILPSLLMTEAETGVSAHGQVPRYSRSELTQWAVEAGYCPKGAPEEEPASITAVTPDDTVLGLLCIDAARLHITLVF